MMRANDLPVQGGGLPGLLVEMVGGCLTLLQCSFSVVGEQPDTK